MRSHHFCADGCTKLDTDRYPYRGADGGTYGCSDSCTNCQAYCCADGCTYCGADARTDGYADVCTYRYADEHTDASTY